ncbi:MAG: cytochrome c family protein [Planctomycetes bacterium]|nr:cytochrome c family protein [Planctomycetota bacterium]
MTFLAGLLVTGLVAWLALTGTDAEARLGPGVHPVIQPNLKYMGNASCAGSGCHGDDKAKQQSGKNIGDESNVWAAGDPHHHALDSLKTPESKKIADTLKIADAAASSRCITCHGMDVPKEKQGEQFTALDSVGCESCHGPSEKWLNPHADAGWVPKQRAAGGAKGLLDKFGLADTSDLEVRANTCVACHLQIDKDMIDAGHPALEFEMYAYDYYISKKGKEWAIHWDEPKGKMIDAKLWATGQAAALEAAKAQTAAWKAKGWDTKDADGLVKVYEAGVAVAKKHFGSDTAAGLKAAAYTPEATAAAAADLAAAAPTAANIMQRRVIAFGVTALGSAAFDGRGKEAPDEFWKAYDIAIKGEAGDAYVSAVKKLAELAK